MWQNHNSELADWGRGGRREEWVGGLWGEGERGRGGEGEWEIGREGDKGTVE